MKRVFLNRLRSSFALLLVFIWSTAAGIARAGTISGSYSNLSLGSVVDLTAAGPADWLHWGLHTETSLDRKSSVPSQISNYTLLLGTDGYAQVFQYADNANGYSWSDGLPALSVTNTTTGLWAYSFPVAEGVGFEIIAPADARPRILMVYVGVYSGQGELTATLSDNSAPPYVDSSLSYNGNGDSRVYVLNYAADAAGQNLRVAWRLKKKQGGATQSPNVTLQAAALATPGINIPPGVSVISPSATAQFPSGHPITVEAESDDVDGSVTNVTFFEDGTRIGESANRPYAVIWSGAPLGLHELTAVATDNTGESSTSPPVEIVVFGPGGLLSGSLTSPPPALVNLTLEGTLDWIHWGLTSSNSVDRSASASTLITNFSRLGTNSLQRLTDSATTWLWTNGNPNLNSAGTASGIFVSGRANGFELSIPASTRPRRLKVYAGLYGAQVGFRAYLSDFSSPVYYGSSSNIYDTSDSVFTLQFASASGDQALVVRLETQLLFDPLFGNLRLMSADLQEEDPVVVPFRLVEPKLAGDDFLFSFDTQSNHLYTIEWADALPGTSWTTLTNLAGTGHRVTVTNSSTAAERRYFRAKAQ